MNRENFFRKYDRIIGQLGDEKPGLLLHSCCGPCSSSVIELLAKNFEVTVLWYNPNLWPEKEFEKRLETQKQLLSCLDKDGIHAQLLVCPWRSEDYMSRIKGLENEPEEGARCLECFRIRLEETARTAAERGFDWFCTTLTVSSRKDAVAINAIGRQAEEKYGHTIYLVSDEPYRELVYDGIQVPCVMHFYDDTIICYSFSKSLSLPGERVGYLAVSSRMAEKEKVFASIAGAARACGYVNAPSMMQRVIEKCLGQTADISQYKQSRDLLYGGLTALGFDCVKPDGAFYLFMKTPEPDAKAFSERAKKFELLLVPSDDFGLPGYVRIAYCVSPEMIQRSMPAFRQLAEEYGL